MNKRIIGIVCGVLISMVAIGQRNETARSATVVKPIVKTENPSTDKTDQFEIQGLGGTTFSTANSYDGTPGSYQHSLRINVTLLPVLKTGNNSFQLVFYSDPREYPQAASYSGGLLNIYYPISLYDGIKDKLEQAIANRKKVFVKVIQKTDGYREGSLIF